MVHKEKIKEGMVLWYDTKTSVWNHGRDCGHVERVKDDKVELKVECGNLYGDYWWEYYWIELDNLYLTCK